MENQKFEIHMTSHPQVRNDAIFLKIEIKLVISNPKDLFIKISWIRIRQLNIDLGGFGKKQTYHQR